MKLPPLPLALVLLTLAGSATAADPSPAAPTGTWQTTLHGRTLQGQAVPLDSPQAAFVYDSTLDVTWLRHWPDFGGVSHAHALSWAENVTIGGFSDWRLPRALDLGAAGCAAITYDGGDCGFNVAVGGPGAYNEMAHLSAVTLGNLGAFTTSGEFRGWDQYGTTWGLLQRASFEGLSHLGYWTGTFGARPALDAFSFAFSNGSQYDEDRSGLRLVTVVRDGDVLSAVPEPAGGALALLGAGIVGFVRRRARR